MKSLWVALAGLAVVGWYGTRAAPAPMDTATVQREAGAWFVDQLDRDRIWNPARRAKAMNMCIGNHMRGGKVNWPGARSCYELLVAWQ